MLERFKRWRQKRAKLRTIKYAMRILEGLYPSVSSASRHILVKTVWSLVAEYGNTYNEQNTANFYFNQINDIVMTEGN